MIIPLSGVSREAHKREKLRKTLVVFAVGEAILKNIAINSRLKTKEGKYFLREGNFSSRSRLER